MKRELPLRVESRRPARGAKRQVLTTSDRSADFYGRSSVSWSTAVGGPLFGDCARRRSKRSPLRYAASTLFETACARAISATSFGALLCSAAQSRNVERKPCAVRSSRPMRREQHQHRHAAERLIGLLAREDVAASSDLLHLGEDVQKLVPQEARDAHDVLSSSPVEGAKGGRRCPLHSKVRQEFCCFACMSGCKTPRPGPICPPRREELS